MSPTEKRNYRPADRLHISSQAYTEKHVRNIAARLAERHSATIPSYNLTNQDRCAHWITTNFQRDEISECERLVRQSYSYGEKIYRKGRPIGSKNINKYTPTKEATDWLEDIGATEDAQSEPEVNSPEDEKRAESIGPMVASMMREYVKKPELEAHINRIGDDVNSHMHRHNDAIKTYIELSIDTLEKKIAATKPTIVTLERPNLPAIELGTQHKHFPELLLMCNARNRDGSRNNIWIYGPAGTGKTMAAKMVAKAMALKFYSMSALETGFQILGYNDANGNYVTTLFRLCWEFGGMIILDEIDSYQPSAALALNGALANGYCAFADKIVDRHPDCIIIAGANTTGLGGTMEYSGRMKQDAAFLNRWCPLDWPLDEALEDALCANKEWLTIVRKVRANVIRVQLKGTMITPRATIYGESLLAAGLSLDRVMKSVLQGGMSEAQWGQVKP